MQFYEVSGHWTFFLSIMYIEKSIWLFKISQTEKENAVYHLHVGSKKAKLLGTDWNGDCPGLGGGGNWEMSVQEHKMRKCQGSDPQAGVIINVTVSHT